MLQLAEKSACGNCGQPCLELLCDKDMRPGKPAFYICFNCGTIGEAGAGPVPRIGSRPSGGVLK